MSILGNLAKTAAKITGFGAGLSQALTGKYTAGLKNRDKDSAEVENDQAVEILGNIFALMQKAREEELQTQINAKRTEDKKKEARDNQNDEIVKALTIRRKPKKKLAPPKEKKKEVEDKSVKDKADKAVKNKKVEERKVETKKTVEEVKPDVKVPSNVVSTATKIAGAAVLAGGAAEVIAKEEGVATKGYWDPPGQKTLVSIGYGHQIKPEEYKQGFIQAGNEQIPIKGEKGIDTKLTKAQAKELLKIDLPKYEKRASAPLGDSWNKLNENQKSALTSYSYNTGGTSDLVKKGLKTAIDNGDIAGAARIIEDGKKTAGGVYNKVLDERRHREAALFASSEKSTEIKKSVNATVPLNNQLGNQIDQASKENRDMKSAAEIKNQTNVNNTNVMQNQAASKQSVHQEEVDDRPAPFRK